MEKELSELYPDHIRTLKDRHDRILAETGFDHVVIFGGSERTVFLDDYPYPFKVNPHFKAWVPVLSNPNCFLVYTPGQKPLLIYFRPVDYWHKPAGQPQGYWVEQFDIRMTGTLEDARVSPSGGWANRPDRRSRWRGGKLGLRGGESQRAPGSDSLRPGLEDGL